MYLWQYIKILWEIKITNLSLPLSAPPLLPPHRQLVVMALAAACLHLFAQSNWTGPSLQILHSDLLPAALLSSQVPPLYVVPSIYSLCARAVSAHALKT